MDFSSLSSNQFAMFLPVGVVIVFAVLVFAFGFKSSVEPPSFKHIDFTADEKRSKKKTKVKDKKSHANGHATVVIDVPDAKKAESAKSTKQTSKTETPKQRKAAEADKPVEKKSELPKSPAKKEKKTEGKLNKKNVVEKPADFDEGEWETQPSRKDKKKKKEDDPIKEIIASLTPEKVSKKKVTAAPKKEIVEKVELKVQDTAQLIEATSVLPVPASDPVPAAPAEVKVAEEPIDEQLGKKKKGKKAKNSVSEEDVLVTETPAPLAPPVEAVQAEVSPALAFNELEDSWKDAPQKKSKKKVADAAGARYDSGDYQPSEPAPATTAA